MSKPVSIPLSEPLVGHNGAITAIVLRQPTYNDYVECGGEPYSIGRSEEGTLFSAEKPEVIWAYAEACIVEPADPLLLLKADWRAAREVRKAILGFFQDLDEASETSATSQTTSSSS